LNVQAEAPTTSNNGRRKAVIAVVLIVLVLGGFAYWLMGRGKVSTDDAQVNGDLVPISPRVAGYLDSIAVQDNQEVKAGQLLVQLDTRDLEAKVRKAEADLATQQAQAAAATGQLSLTERTAPSGAQQATAGVGFAESGVGAAEKQVSSAREQVAAAVANIDAARGVVSAARSAIAVASAQVQSAQAAVEGSQADVTSASAQAKKAAADEARYRQLFTSGAVSQQQLDAMEAANTSAQAALKASRDRSRAAAAALEQAKAQRSSAQAGLKQATARLSSAIAVEKQARAGVGVAQSGLSQARSQVTRAVAAESGSATVPQQISVSRAQSNAAAARIKQSLADLRNARLQLSYTRIVAPVDGVVSQKSAEPGQYVQPGQLLMSIVPLRNVWVVANYKETQIGKMRVDQHVEIDVDSLPGKTFSGKIQSIGAATGSKFSLLPAENATGNYIKVVQRIPVKILFDEPIPQGMVLRPGQNVTATVYLSR
jgi:membrane fusion protein (multidrug efflux system)